MGTICEQADQRAVYITKTEKAEVIGSDGGSLGGASFKVSRFQNFKVTRIHSNNVVQKLTFVFETLKL